MILGYQPCLGQECPDVPEALTELEADVLCIDTVEACWIINRLAVSEKGWCFTRCSKMFYFQLPKIGVSFFQFDCCNVKNHQLVYNWIKFLNLKLPGGTFPVVCTWNLCWRLPTRWVFVGDWDFLFFFVCNMARVGLGSRFVSSKFCHSACFEVSSLHAHAFDREHGKEKVLACH